MNVGVVEMAEVLGSGRVLVDETGDVALADAGLLTTHNFLGRSS